jgi:tRNA threonylcarbamoyl adenosine modification protein YjeE
MARDAQEQGVWRIDVADESETAAVAHEVVALLRRGDMVTLSGDLGAGKTTFARAVIRNLFSDPGLEAPSPTFTLMQLYEKGGLRLVHADFYRINDASELPGLGWEEAIEDAVTLVEWAERAQDRLPKDRLDVHLGFGDPDHRDARCITVTGFGAFAARLAPFRALRQLLRTEGWSDARRVFLQGDASSRAYEALEKANGERAILMISPPRPDGPPVRYGKSYSAIARLAENVRPFVAIADGLRAFGFSAPRILGHDLDAGLLIVEDLGSDGVVDATGPIPDRYLEAAAVLASLHAQALPEMLPVDGAGDYRIPAYDLDALLIEVELMLDWYLAHLRVIISSGARATFVNLWRDALAEIIAARATWTLRDYHSPNLLWLPEREGLARIGIIDFQDCVLGHPAYDLASLGQDARVDVPDDLELRLLAHYARLRRAGDPTFDMPAFARAYAVLAAQRATKILGIFARLNQRDGKPQYLRHLPRIEGYLRKSLQHPALADIKAWCESNTPALLTGD